MATTYITVTKSASFHEGSGLFRLKVWVGYTAYNIPSEIFLVQDVPTYPIQGYADETFVSSAFVRTATYADMLNYPSGSGDEVTPYRRVRSLYLTFMTATQLSTTWTALQANIQELVDEIAAVHAAVPVVTEVSV